MGDRGLGGRQPDPHGSLQRQPIPWTIRVTAPNPDTDIDPGTGLATQTVTATFDTSFATEKFFKAKIDFPISEVQEE